MSEEEKEAIEYLENRLDILHNNTQWATEKSIKVVLNLIDKQKKEIEELSQYKESVEGLKSKNKIIIDNNELRLFLKRDYISKGKIKDILNYLNNTELNNYEIVMAFKKMMKELLEDDGDHIPRID